MPRLRTLGAGLAGVLLLAGLLLGLRPAARLQPPSPGAGTLTTVSGKPLSTPGPALAPSLALSPSPEAGPTLWPSPAGVTTAVTENPVPASREYTYSVVATYPHDSTAYTQGLVFANGGLYESTGRYGESTLRRVALETGEVLQLRALPPETFGEGMALIGDEIVQLTWKSHLGFVYARDSFDLLRTFDYPTEGWGLTTDGLWNDNGTPQRLIMSDGTDTLRFWDPMTLEEIGRLQIRDGQTPVTMLNELEYIGGLVYANVWKTDRIAMIDLSTGQVAGWIDLAGLLGPEDRGEGVDVLNGIAYDPELDRLFVTGKWWPKLFEIDLVPRS